MDVLEFRDKIKQIDDNDGVGMGVAVFYLVNGEKIISQTHSIDSHLSYVFLHSVHDEPSATKRELLYVDIVDVQDYSVIGKDLSA